MGAAVRPNFPAALALQPSAPRSGDGAEAWCHDSPEDIEMYGIAGRIWYVMPTHDRESAYLMLAYLTNSGTWDPPRTLLEGPVSVIELGAGVGTAGLATAQALDQRGIRSTVVLTDLPDVCSLLERNASTCACTHVDILVQPLPWGDRASAQAVLRNMRPPTHILCSDLIYFPELLAPLLRTLIDLTDNAPTAEVLLSYKIRSLTKEQPFWCGFCAWFELTVVDYAREPRAPMQPFGTQACHFGAYPPPCAPDGQLLDEYFLFVAHRRPESHRWESPTSDAAMLQGQYVCDGQMKTAPTTGTFEWLLLSRATEDIHLH